MTDIIRQSVHRFALSSSKGFAPTPVLPSLRFFKKEQSLFCKFLQISRHATRSVGALKQWQNRCGGFGMVEIIVGAAVLSTALLGIATFFQSTLAVSGTTSAAIQGDYLLEEGMEIVKLLRDESYAANIFKFSTTTPTYLAWSGTMWATSTTNTFIDGKFERSIGAEDVVRDVNGDIAASGTFDPNTKLITVTVAWQTKGATTTKTIQTYIMNIFNG